MGNDAGQLAGYRKAQKQIADAQRSGAKALDLIDLGLTTLPPEIASLTALQTLHLFSNRLTTLPPEIASLASLQALYLGDNWFATLPAVVGSLSSLQTLDLEDNRLAVLPPEVASLTSLRALYLQSNKLTTLPPEIGSLAALEQLDLDGNGLTTLPPEIGSLTAMRELDLTDNRLASLPPEMARLTRLTELYLHGNPDLGLPLEILGPTVLDRLGRGAKPKPPEEILDYYFSTVAGARGLREVKLILVGRGEVGKTTLAEALQGRPFKKNRPRTDGISITPWPVKPKGGDAVVRIWDFGGQEIMHGTHQFFLSRRAVYVVMVDGRDDRYQREAEYWLKLVRAFGGNSTVMVVMNRQKDYKFDLDRNALATKYGVSPDLFFATECSQKKTITAVRKAILDVVGEVLSTQANFPAKWWEIKTHLEQMEEDYLSDKAYRELCEAQGIKDTAEQDQLLDRLNDLGTIVHFSDDDNLAELKVLDPEWATDGVYRVVTNEKLREEKRGKLKAGTLKDILPRERWPGAVHRRYILDLMQRFDLCFPAEGEKDVFIVPELLPEMTPDLSGWDAKAGVVFRYQYPVLPHGILPRFISKTHTLSEGKYRWRSGVVVAKDGAEALARADYDASTIDIWVRGKYRDMRRALLTIIRDKFEEIHARIKELNPVEMVGVPGYPSVFVPYLDLILDARDEKEKYRVTIAGNRVDLPLSDLLDGVASPEERKQAEERAAPCRASFPAGNVIYDNSIHMRDVTDSQVAHAMDRARNKTGGEAPGTED